jgi:hypothetical protein
MKRAGRLAYGQTEQAPTGIHADYRLPRRDAVYPGRNL